MKRLILILCISMVGQIYGQNPFARELALLDKIDESIAEGTKFFDHEMNVFHDFRINQSEAISYFGNKRKEFAEAAMASTVNTDIALIIGNLFTCYATTQMYIRTVNIKGCDEALTESLKQGSEWARDFLFVVLQDMRTSINNCLKRISEHEDIYVGTYAQNILNLKKELRDLRQFCNDILEAS